MGIREDMPLLARHEGVWDGTYTYFNAANEKIDEHQSRSNRASTGSALRLCLTHLPQEKRKLLGSFAQ